MVDDAASPKPDDLVYERETQSQFVPQEDDEQVLWEVIEITAEKGKYYKVRWAGSDPATGKPWPQSWVQKQDCTDDLVIQWKCKKDLKKKRKGRSSAASKKSRGSNSHVSAASGSTNTTVKRSTRLASGTPNKNGKRTHSVALGLADSEEAQGLADVSAPSRPTKKRRVASLHETAPEFEERDIPDQVPQKRDERVSQGKDRATKPEQQAGSPKPEHQPEAPTKVRSTAKAKPKPKANYPVAQMSPHPQTPDLMVIASKIATPKTKRPRSPSPNNDELMTHRLPKHTSPRLSEGALERLREFDEWGLRLEYTMPHKDHAHRPSKPPYPTKPIARLSGTRARPQHDSYRLDIVPETETESAGNTQSQSQLHQSQPEPPIHSYVPDPQLKPHLSDLDAPKPSIEPYSKPASTSSIVSKMKQRIPGSSSHIDDIDVDNFPYIPSEPEELRPENEEEDEVKMRTPVLRSRSGSNRSVALHPIPQLSPSTFTAHLRSSSVGRAADGDQDEEADADGLMSSIEQFSSPEKEGRSRIKGKRRLVKGKGRAVDSDAEVEAETESVTDQDDDTQGQFETTVRERGKVLADRAREERLRQQGTVASSGERNRQTLNELLGVRPKSRQKREKAKRRENQKILRLRQNKQHPSTETQLQQIAMLREEEEESTQDLLKEAEDMRPLEDVEMNNGWDIEHRTDAMMQEPESQPQVEEEQEHRTRPKSSSPIISQPEQQSQPEDKPIRSATPQIVHPPLPPEQKVQPEYEGVISPMQQISYPTPDDDRQASPSKLDLAATVQLLNEKSRENAQLCQEIETLRSALATATDATPQFESSEIQHELVEVRASRDAALASLSASEKRVADLTRGKEGAERDLEFFREQYAKASGFITSVREENNELEEQVKIAKEQAATGVEAVKAIFAARVKMLEEDIVHWRRMAMFLMEKDIRTNDGIRRRAAEEPELRVQCDVLDDENRAMKELLDTLQDDLQEREAQTRDLEAELMQSKKDVARLTVALSSSQAKLESVSKDIEDLAKGDEMVYRCQWRLESGSDVCNGLFSNTEVRYLSVASIKCLTPA
ncbi:hypothetical protein H0H81_001692 [Sphagnurus paluster]|uniref:Chromo domain-containing protein n=1 Tax=Sphagnurus paluster TaxID=117069 RepID=A0A9P7GTL3_9AGAR|nr:hypothetical protein H0H81_001692 [Sphagnurus paluster]